MSKYIDADKLIKSVNNYQEWAKAESNPTYGYADYYKGKIDACKDIQEFITSLGQEQPEADFKIEERKWVHDAVDNIFPEDGDFMSEVDFRKIIKDTARHFYELGQCNTRKK